MVLVTSLPTNNIREEPIDGVIDPECESPQCRRTEQEQGRVIDSRGKACAIRQAEGKVTLQTMSLPAG